MTQADGVMLYPSEKNWYKICALKSIVIMTTLLHSRDEDVLSSIIHVLAIELNLAILFMFCPCFKLILMPEYFFHSLSCEVWWFWCFNHIVLKFNFELVWKMLNNTGTAQSSLILSGAAGNFLCPAESLSFNAFRTVMDIDTMGTYNATKVVFDEYMKVCTHQTLEQLVRDLMIYKCKLPLCYTSFC